VTVSSYHSETLTDTDYYLGCRYSYRNNYAIQNGIRHYYGGVPDYIQVGEHQFVEKKLVSLWVNMMLVGWSVGHCFSTNRCCTDLQQCVRFSATNCAKVYDMSLSDRDNGHLESAGWQFGSKLRTEHVWDAFVLITLIRDCDARFRQLEVPHSGLQKDRFTAAMEERNLRIICDGQDEIDHVCDTCTRTFTEVLPNGTKITRMSPLSSWHRLFY